MKKLLIFLVVIILLGTAYHFGFRAGYFVVREVECGDEISKYDLLDAAGIEYGENIFLISTTKIEDNLEHSPGIKSAKVSRRLPDILVIELVLREPYAVMVFAGNNISIDDEGITTFNSEKKAPRITGFTIERYVVGLEMEVAEKLEFEKVMNLVELLNQFAEIEAPTIEMKDREIYLWIDDDYVAKFGRGENIEIKFNNFVDIYTDLVSTGRQQGVIDVSVDEMPLYKPFYEEGDSLE